MNTMLVMGSNTWQADMPKQAIIGFSLKWAEGLKSQGIADLQGAWINMEKKLLWCYWETDDLDALQVAFDEMNKQSGLESELTVIEQYYPT